MANSFYPAARKVFSNPAVKWVLGVVGGLLIAAITTGIWPFFRGWLLTRASTDDVDEINGRVTIIEKSREVDDARLNSALGDDTGKLTEAEKLRWTIIRVKRLEMRLYSATRARVSMEARLKMPKPNSEAAKRIAGTVTKEFDKLVREGDDPDTAARRAMAYTFGTEEPE
jgi:hypothetical protein